MRGIRYLRELRYASLWLYVLFSSIRILWTYYDSMMWVPSYKFHCEMLPRLSENGKAINFIVWETELMFILITFKNVRLLTRARFSKVIIYSIYNFWMWKTDRILIKEILIYRGRYAFSICQYSILYFSI